MTKSDGGQFALASPAPNSGGTCPPVSPVINAHDCKNSDVAKSSLNAVRDNNITDL